MPGPFLSLTPALEAQLRAWLDEDLGRGDLTAPALAGRPAPLGLQGGGCAVRRAVGLIVRLPPAYIHQANSRD
jgi:hypothetical protein